MLLPFVFCTACLFVSRSEQLRKQFDVDLPNGTTQSDVEKYLNEQGFEFASGGPKPFGDGNERLFRTVYGTIREDHRFFGQSKVFFEFYFDEKDKLVHRRVFDASPMP